jgi:hypothetical protein
MFNHHGPTIIENFLVAIKKQLWVAIEKLFR